MKELTADEIIEHNSLLNRIEELVPVALALLRADLIPERTGAFMAYVLSDEGVANYQPKYKGQLSWLVDEIMRADRNNERQVRRAEHEPEDRRWAAGYKGSGSKSKASKRKASAA